MADQEIGDRADDDARLPVDLDWSGRAGLTFRLGDSLSRLRSWLGATFEREVELGRATLWLPVLFGVGALVYFGLPREPGFLPLLLLTGALAVGAFALRERAGAFRLAAALLAVVAGVTVAKTKTEIVAAPMIAEEYVGDLTGWIEELERMGPRQVRLVVRVLSLEDVAPEATPGKVRITVRGNVDAFAVGVGVAGLVGLQPPAAPVIPGGYDFGREIFYRGIGASGFSYGPPAVVDLGPAPLGVRWRVPIERFRQTVGERIEAALPGDVGQIANALITGDRGGVSDPTTEAYRVSGLTHILSISGLHMALVAGAAFGGLRAILALFPSLALRRPIKKWAAGGALAVATFYLLVSGAEIATQRSYIMLAVMLSAVLLDRRALSIRNIAVAATIVLFLTPEAILTAGFQMSFAATLALIAGYEVVAERRRDRLAVGPGKRRSLPRWVLLWIGGLLLTSLLAGLATAPFGAFHFNRTQPLSLVANLLAIPFVSAVVMPAALLAMILMPFGLDGPALWLMGKGIEVVNGIAEQVTVWTGDSGLVAASPPVALYLAVLGIVWLCLWRERWRLFGILPIAVGIALAGTAARPDILVEETGTAAMVRAADGAYRFMGRGATFEVENWLRMDGDPRATNDRALGEGVFCDPLGCTAELGDTGLRVALVTNPLAFAEDCDRAAVVITTLVAPEDCRALVVDRDELVRFDVHALYVTDPSEEGPIFRVVTVRPEERRPWMPPLPAQ